jgi:hypothetical protein
LTLPTIVDALPGRVEYVRLWPFSQGELRAVHERFIDALLGSMVTVIDTSLARPYGTVIP